MSLFWRRKSYYEHGINTFQFTVSVGPVNWVISTLVRANNGCNAALAALSAVQ